MPLRLAVTPLTPYARNQMFDNECLLLEIRMTCKAKGISNKRWRFNLVSNRLILSLLSDGGLVGPLFK